MLEQRTAPGVREYLSIGEAATFLGVTHWTLRNWDRTGKLKPHRHPLNGYRLYRREDLEAILEALANSATGRGRRR